MLLQLQRVCNSAESALVVIVHDSVGDARNETCEKCGWHVELEGECTTYDVRCTVY